MKAIKFASFLFYRYYLTGPTEEIAYFSTLLAMSMIAFMNLMQLAILTHQVDNFLPIKSTDTKAHKYFISALVLLPILLSFKLIVKENELKSMIYSADRIRRGWFFLIAYVILTMTLLVVLIVSSKNM